MNPPKARPHPYRSRVASTPNVTARPLLRAVHDKFSNVAMADRSASVRNLQFSSPLPFPRGRGREREWRWRVGTPLTTKSRLSTQPLVCFEPKCMADLIGVSELLRVANAVLLSLGFFSCTSPHVPAVANCRQTSEGGHSLPRLRLKV